MDINEKYARYVLSGSEGVGPAKFLKILQEFPSIYDFINQNQNELIKQIGERLASNVQLSKKKTNLDEITTLKFLVFGEKDYPTYLSNMSDPPIVLYYKGDIGLCSAIKIISIVGTRNVTSYGVRNTQMIVKDLVERGFVTVSGLAYGVDKEVHLATLNNNGKTIAVLPSGVNNPVPYRNIHVYERIIEEGGLIVSELKDSEKISIGSFPRRNRIIAGISMGTVITEAAKKSGALITADIAFRENRPVFALPGEVGKLMSEGTNNLIRDNKAKLINSVDDILSEFEYINSTNQKKNEIVFSSDLKKQLYLLLKKENMCIDKLVSETNLKTNEIISTISEMELEGMISKDEDDSYRIVIN